jgi:thioredoxin 1
MDITSQNFKSEVTDYKGKVLVDFWASWCGPCQMLAPIIEELGEELKDKLKIGKVDVDAEPALAGQFNVSGIPSVLIFDNGKLIETIVGFHQKSDYLKVLNK